MRLVLLAQLNIHHIFSRILAAFFGPRKSIAEVRQTKIFEFLESNFDEDIFLISHQVPQMEGNSSTKTTF